MAKCNKCGKSGDVLRLLREIAGTGSGRNGVGNAFLFFIRNFRVQGIRKGTAGCGALVGNGVSMLREDRALNGSHGPDSAATGRKAAGIVSVCGLTNNESGAPCVFRRVVQLRNGVAVCTPIFRTGDERRDKPRLRPVKTDSPSRNGSGNRGFVRYAEVLSPERCDTLFQRFDLGLGVVLFGSLVLYHLCRGVLHEALVA